MHFAGRRDRDAWLGDRHLYKAGERRGSGGWPRALKPRHGIRRCFKARQEVALFGEAAVNTGRVMQPVQRFGTDEHEVPHPQRKSLMCLVYFSIESGSYFQQLNKIILQSTLNVINQWLFKKLQSPHLCRQRLLLSACVFVCVFV